jgi:hypothetical protein
MALPAALRSRLRLVKAIRPLYNRSKSNPSCFTTTTRKASQPVFLTNNGVSNQPRNDIEIEEETLPRYDPDKFLPVRVGDILHETYRVTAKLGFGTSSTVWLCSNVK